MDSATADQERQGKGGCGRRRAVVPRLSGTVSPGLPQAPKDGYVRAFVAGSRPKKIDPRVSSRSSVETWTYTARPVAPGRTGYRSFFADETGVIRATSEDRAANVSDPPIE